MTDPRTDEIARQAARLIETGKVKSINSAIRQASHSLGFKNVSLPSVLLVRQHAQAMSMQLKGNVGYDESRRRVWEVAEEIMTMFEHAMPDARTVLVGRAAKGHIDAGVKVHIRLYTRASSTDIATLLVEYGYEEPKFKAVKTQHGRLSQIHIVEDDVEVVLTCCTPEIYGTVDTDLFSGKPVEAIDVGEVRKRLSKSTL